MFDVALARELLTRLHQSATTILRRFEPITSPGDFTASEEGMEKLDAICMQLIAIGEGVKQLDRVTKGSLLSRYSEVEWKRVKGMRDVLSHQYFDVDAEVVYWVCANRVEPLARTIQRMLDELQ